MLQLVWEAIKKNFWSMKLWDDDDDDDGQKKTTKEIWWLKMKNKWEDNSFSMILVQQFCTILLCLSKHWDEILWHHLALLFLCIGKGRKSQSGNKNQDRLLWYFIPLHSIMHVGEEEKKQRWMEIMSMWKKEAIVNRKFCVFSSWPIKNFFVKST